MTHGADMDTYKTSTEFIERSMLNSTYNDIHTNKWAREGTKVVGIFGSVRKRNGPGHGISTAPKTTDGPRMSPLGDHTTREDDKEGQPSGGQILERHDLAVGNAIHANLEAACGGLRSTTRHYRCTMMMMMIFPNFEHTPIIIFDLIIFPMRAFTW